MQTFLKNYLSSVKGQGSKVCGLSSLEFVLCVSREMNGRFRGQHAGQQKKGPFHFTACPHLILVRPGICPNVISCVQGHVMEIIWVSMSFFLLFIFVVE